MPDFIHQFLPAANAASARTVLLLHGTGGDECDLVPVGRAVAPGFNLLSPRGRVSEQGMARFFPRLSEGAFDEDSIRSESAALAEFAREAAARYGFDPRRVSALGYSNGAHMAAALLLLHPAALDSAVLMRATLPLAPAELPSLDGKHVLILAGQFDQALKADGAEALARMLAAAGGQVEVRWHQLGHELSPEDFGAAKNFFKSLA